MATFDDLQVRRPELAKSYLALIDAQPGRPLAMFAPRRVGKTYFLDHDLAPPIKKIGLIGASVDLGDAPARRALPTAPQLRLDAWVVRLANAAQKPVLLMLDEVQTLGDAEGGDSTIAALRAVLHKRRDILK